MKKNISYKVSSALMCAAMAGTTVATPIMSQVSADTDENAVIQEVMQSDVTGNFVNDIPVFVNQSTSAMTFDGTQQVETFTRKVLSMTGVELDEDTAFRIDWVATDGLRSVLRSGDADADAKQEVQTLSDLFDFVAKQSRETTFVIFTNDYEITRIVMSVQEDGSVLVDTVKGTPDVSYLVRFDANGGELSGASFVMRAQGEQLSYVETTATYDRHAFDGWYDAKVGGNKIDETTAINSNMRLYAHWIADTYRVDFDTQGGNEIESKFVSIDEALYNLPVPEKEGYTFLGWYSEAEGGDRVISIKNAEDVTLYAHWKAAVVTPGSGNASDKDDNTVTTPDDGNASDKDDNTVTTPDDGNASDKDDNTVTTPDDGNASDKDDNTVTTPDDGNASDKDDNTVTTPDDGNASDKDDNTVTTPDDGNASDKDDNTVTTPDDGNASDKDDNTVTTPDDGNASDKDDNTITTPDDGNASDKDDNTVTTPDDGNASDKDDNTVTTPDDNTVTTPDDGNVSDKDDNTVTTPDDSNSSDNNNSSNGNTTTKNDGTVNGNQTTNTTAPVVSTYKLNMTKADGSSMNVSVKSTVLLGTLVQKLGYTNISYFSVKTVSGSESSVDSNTTMETLVKLVDAGDILLIAYDSSGEFIGSAKIVKTGDFEYKVSLSKDMDADTNTTTTSSTSTMSTSSESTTTTKDDSLKSATISDESQVDEKGKGEGETPKNDTTAAPVKTSDISVVPIYGTLGSVMTALLGVLAAMKRKLS